MHAALQSLQQGGVAGHPLWGSSRPRFDQCPLLMAPYQTHYSDVMDGWSITGLWVHSVVRWGCVEANSLRRTRSRAHLLVPIESPGIDCAASMAKPPSRGRPGTTALEPTWYLGSSKSQGGWVTSVADVRVRDSPGVFLSRTDTGSPCHQDSMG